MVALTSSQAEFPASEWIESLDQNDQEMLQIAWQRNYDRTMHLIVESEGFKVTSRALPPSLKVHINDPEHSFALQGLRKIVIKDLTRYTK